MTKDEAVTRVALVIAGLKDRGIEVVPLRPEGALTEHMDAVFFISWSRQEPALSYTIAGVRALIIMGQDGNDDIVLEKSDPGAMELQALLEEMVRTSGMDVKEMN